MGYRDDREALHHRVAQLEQELQDARREGEEHGRDEAQSRAMALEQRLASMRGDMEKMGAELSELRGGRPASSRARPLVAMVVGVSLVGLLGSYLMLGTGAPRPPPVVVVTPPTPTPTPTSIPRPVATAAPTIPLERIPQPARSTTARWFAKVSRAEGVALGGDATCTVEAKISTTGTNALVDTLTVQCGALALYRSTDALNGMSQSSDAARELLGPTDDQSTFSLAYRDLGTRTGDRAQIDLDTSHRQASIFRETIPRSRVDLVLATASTPAPSLAGPAQRLRHAMKVTSTSGAAPVKEGAACVLRAMPTGQQAACAAEVRCGTTVLWPASEPVTCTYEGARPATIAGGTAPATISFLTPALEVKARAFSAELTVDAP